MSDDYLWDGSGEPDPDVARAEQLLGKLRSPLPPLRSPKGLRHTEPGGPAPVAQPFRAAKTYAGIRFYAPALAAAAAIVLMIAATWRGTTKPVAWDVERLAGRPRIGSTSFDESGRMGVGQTLVTDAASRARMDVSTIGQVVADTNTRVRLVETRQGRHKLALERGTLHAFITAPPGQFVVDTPSSTATDLGCVYTLEVDEDGTGLLSVTAGWVAFEYKGRESFVPAGASSRTDDRRGPGTPRYDDADEAFKRALDRVDAGQDRGNEALGYVLTHARPKDAMTLWHLVARVNANDRAIVIDALAARVPMPDGVTRENVLKLDRNAMDLWWDSLGLRDAGWWRKWKQERIW